MLEIDPEKRITVESCLKHEFFNAQIADNDSIKVDESDSNNEEIRDK